MKSGQHLVIGIHEMISMGRGRRDEANEPAPTPQRKWRMKMRRGTGREERAFRLGLGVYNRSLAWTADLSILRPVTLSGPKAQEDVKWDPPFQQKSFPSKKKVG